MESMSRADGFRDKVAAYDREMAGVRVSGGAKIAAVVFDLDGVLIDTEQVWDDVRERLARERGGRWHERAQADMMGMSSPEWSQYMRGVIGLPGTAAEINAEVVEGMLARYREALPLIAGAVDAVRRLAAHFPLAVASSSNRPLIETVLSGAGFADLFAVTVSSEQVGSAERALPSRRRRPRACRCRALLSRGPHYRDSVRRGLGPTSESRAHRPPPHGSTATRVLRAGQRSAGRRTTDRALTGR